MELRLKQGTVMTVLLLTMLAVTSVPNAMAHTEESPFVTDLIAGQYYDVGDVLVWNDADYLYVKYETSGSWSLATTHLQVATSLSGIPQVNGNPPPGQFDYQTEHDPSVDEVTYAIDLVWPPSTQLYIAAHADVCEFANGGPVPADGVLATAPLYAWPYLENVGSVQVAVVGENLVVTMQTTGGWLMLDSALYLGNMPPTSFYWYDWPQVHLGLGEVTIDTFVAPLSSLGVACGDTFYVSTTTYAVIRANGGEWFRQCWSDENPFDGWTKYFAVQIPPCQYECETAWGDGLDFPGKNWAMYFTYAVQ